MQGARTGEQAGGGGVAAASAGTGRGGGCSQGAAGLNFFDTLIIEGKYQYKPDPPFSPAAEFAGIVVDRLEVRQVKPGDRVMGFCGWGAAREEVAVPASALAAMPPSISFEEAAGLIVPSTTFHALHDRAGSGLARRWRSSGHRAESARRQSSLARRWGAGHRLRLVGGQACGCRLLGADEVVNYSQVELRDELKRLTDGRGVDVVYDPVGALSEAALRATGWDGGSSRSALPRERSPRSAQSRVAEGLRGGRGVLGRSRCARARQAPGEYGETRGIVRLGTDPAADRPGFPARGGRGSSACCRGARRRGR